MTQWYICVHAYYLLIYAQYVIGWICIVCSVYLCKYCRIMDTLLLMFTWYNITTASINEMFDKNRNGMYVIERISI